MPAVPCLPILGFSEAIIIGKLSQQVQITQDKNHDVSCRWNFRSHSWDCFPQVMNYEDFKIISCQIKGILLYYIPWISFFMLCMKPFHCRLKIVSWSNCSNWKHSEYTYSCRCANCRVCYQVFIVTVTEMVVWVIAWVIAPYKLLTLFQHFKGTKRFRWVLKLREPICYPPDGGSTFLCSVWRNIMQNRFWTHLS